MKAARPTTVGADDTALRAAVPDRMSFEHDHTSVVRLGGWLGLLGAALFGVTLAALHAAHSIPDWTDHYVSEFANDMHGSVFAAVLFLHGLGNLALSAALYLALSPSRLRGWATGLLAYSAIGMCIGALYPTDVGGLAKTLDGIVHRIAAFSSFLAELVALYLFSADFSVHSSWRRWARWSFVISSIAAVSLVLLVIAIATNQYPGLAERLAIASQWTWEAIVATILTRHYFQATSAQS